jgi:hypothetical protein
VPDNITYSSEKIDENRFKIWQHVEGSFGRVVCEMSMEDILKLYESVVPEYQEEILVKGDPDCKHSWRPYHFNNHFKLCNDCNAIMKIKRLVPREFK